MHFPNLTANPPTVSTKNATKPQTTPQTPNKPHWFPAEAFPGESLFLHTQIPTGIKICIFGIFLICPGTSLYPTVTSWRRWKKPKQTAKELLIPGIPPKSLDISFVNCLQRGNCWRTPRKEKLGFPYSFSPLRTWGMPGFRVLILFFAVFQEWFSSSSQSYLWRDTKFPTKIYLPWQQEEAGNEFQSARIRGQKTPEKNQPTKKT